MPVRLVGSQGSSHIGRLEVLYNGTWGTVCGKRFDRTEARYLDPGTARKSGRGFDVAEARYSRSGGWALSMKRPGLGLGGIAGRCGLGRSMT